MDAGQHTGGGVRASWPDYYRTRSIVWLGTYLPTEPTALCTPAGVFGALELHIVTRVQGLSGCPEATGCFAVFGTLFKVLCVCNLLSVCACAWQAIPFEAMRALSGRASCHSMILL